MCKSSIKLTPGCLIKIFFFFNVDNEWKTRFETQQEMNDQLEKQVILLRDKLGQLKIPSRDGKLTAAFFSVSCVCYHLAKSVVVNDI